MVQGYKDTPTLPNTPYCVHDPDRPQPAAVVPPSESSQAAPGTPPSDAVVLFDGSDLSGWESKKGGDAPWTVEGGVAHVVPRSGDIVSKAAFGSCHLHLEYASPSEIKGDGQGRGNSGIFMMDRYEIQVLDSHENPTYADGQCGSIYGEFPPLANPCRPAGEWNVYDIIWDAPTWDGDTLATPARATVILNGIVLHHAVALIGPTGHRDVYDYEKHASEAPLRLQDHGDLVRFRNIWYRPLNTYDA